MKSIKSGHTVYTVFTRAASLVRFILIMVKFVLAYEFFIGHSHRLFAARSFSQIHQKSRRPPSATRSSSCCYRHQLWHKKQIIGEPVVKGDGENVVVAAWMTERLEVSIGRLAFPAYNWDIRSGFWLLQLHQVVFTLSLIPLFAIPKTSNDDDNDGDDDDDDCSANFLSFC